jgi:hypothetical protein
LFTTRTTILLQWLIWLTLQILKGKKELGLGLELKLVLELGLGLELGLRLFVSPSVVGYLVYDQYYFLPQCELFFKTADFARVTVRVSGRGWVKVGVSVRINVRVKG